MIVNGRNVKVNAIFTDRFYYSTTREEVGKSHEDITSAYIWGLYNALMDKYPDRVQKVEHTSTDGTFKNYEYVISTCEYRTDGLYTTPHKENDEYDCKPPIKKPKYLILNAIHGTERKTSLSTYRFICDVLSGRNVPTAFRECAILSVMPVGTPAAFDKFARPNNNDADYNQNVDINRNFDWEWAKGTGTDGSTSFNFGARAASEKETQAIANWLAANKDAELFIDFHNSGQINEKVAVLGLPDNTVSNIARKLALRGVDRVIPFWRGVVGYPTKVDMRKNEEDNADEQDVIFSYSATVGIGGLAFAYAQEVLGIRSIGMETAVYYGSFLEYRANEKTYQPEVIAMGAEALGNILIEFYNHSCEVIKMEDIDDKLDVLKEDIDSNFDALMEEIKALGGNGSGFRTESGTITLDKDSMPESGATSFVFKIPCSNKAKMLEFYADSDTLAAIKKTTGTQYIASVLGNCFAEGIVDGSGKQCGYLSIMGKTTYNGTDYWLLQDRSIRVDNTNGITFNATALKAGTYHWTAYYWND